MTNLALTVGLSISIFVTLHDLGTEYHKLPLKEKLQCLLHSVAGCFLFFLLGTLASK